MQAPLVINVQAMSLNTLFQNLGEREAATAPFVGGKFVSLCRLFEAGVSVPPAICLTTEAFSIMTDKIGSAPLVVNLIDSQYGERYGESVEISKEVSSRIRSAPMPAMIRDSLGTRLSTLAFPLIVRSSATHEDSSNRSFAGIFESVLGVNSVDETLEAIKECWASLFSEKVIAYSKSDVSFFESCKMAVICQEMLNPSVGGVAFTWDPIKGESVFTINSSWGIPSLLVSGEIVPDLYELGKDGTMLHRKRGSKRWTCEFANGRLKTRPATTSEQQHYSLSDRQLREIYHCGKRIESVFCAPQDIEWAIQGDHLYVLQSRAITTIIGTP